MDADMKQLPINLLYNFLAKLSAIDSDFILIQNKEKKNMSAGKLASQSCSFAFILIWMMLSLNTTAKWYFM